MMNDEDDESGVTEIQHSAFIIHHFIYSSSSSSSANSLRSTSEPPEPGIGLPCSSKAMPKSSPMPCRISLISFRDFLPKFFVASISRSERWTRSRMERMLAFFRQLYDLTDSSSSSTERSSTSFLGSGGRSMFW